MLDRRLYQHYLTNHMIHYLRITLIGLSFFKFIDELPNVEFKQILFK